MVLSCKGPEILTEEAYNYELSEEQLSEYNYVLTEATKQKLFGNFRQAVALYQKCIEVNPRSDAAYFQLAGLYVMAGDIAGAKDFNKKAIEINSENYWYRIQLAQIYMMNEETDSAIAVYERITEKWPEKIDIQFEVARLYSEEGSYNKALRILNKVEEDYGISEPVSLLKEQIYLSEGKAEMAEQELLKLIEFDPEEVRYLGILAELYTTIGEKEKGRETNQRGGGER